ncbi:MAG: aldehyde dehydrogenase family protein, partial [Candidatus Sumerlaeia bacterium]|nr:aldehyde dehydrogenase family protein [Candidatus Sumerlaeia bacterium]
EIDPGQPPLPDLNPADTSEVVCEVLPVTQSHVDDAAGAAVRAQRDWARGPAPERARFVARFSELARQRVDELARIMTLEEGKPLREARGEILKGLNIVDFFVGEGWRLGGSTLPSEMPQTFTYTIRQPIGVVGVITPWNFPWAVPLWKITPALVAGNAVVFKPASPTPLVAACICRLFEEAGLPEGVLNLVVGSGRAVGDRLVEHPGIRVLTFTGSNDVGTRLYEMGARKLAKVCCEMGGKNPVVVMPDADLDIAVEGTLQGAFGSTGQRCTATSRVILHEAIHDEFVDRFVAGAKALHVGNGLDPATQMGPVVDQRQLDTDLSYIAIARAEGLACACGGDRLLDDAHARGYFLPPTIFTGVPRASRLFQEEVFGPVLAVTKVKSFDDALDAANDTRYGLTSSIYAADARMIQRFIDGIEAGMVHVNSPTIGGEAQLPFGGIKATGVGDREMAREGIEFFTEIKTVFHDYTGSARKTNIY